MVMQFESDQIWLCQIICKNNMTIPSRQILVPRTSPSNVPRTYPKDPIWPSRGQPNLTSWRRPEMTSRGRLNLTSKGRSWKDDSRHPQNVLRTSPRGPLKHVLGTMWGHLLDVPKFLFLFLLGLIRFTKSI